MSPEFNDRLRRAVRLYLREMRDGCVECRVAKGYCHEHRKVATDVILHPGKYVRVSVSDVTTAEGK